ncbi:MAG: ABC transporter substrate-binding protein [Myxococcales bacterium]|nr:ABC transporter substrate-binding protein [Myxococcales bacterium]
MAVAVALAGGAAACGDGPGDTTPVMVGLLAPKTGALQQVGESFERVAQVAVAKLNEVGGINGRDVELLVDDTATDATTAGAKLAGLIDQGVIAVVGPATSGEVTNAYPIAAARHVPIISPSSTAPALSDPDLAPPDDGYMFRNVPDDNTQGAAIAYYLTELREPRTRSVTVLYEDSPYGVGLKDAFERTYATLRGSVAAEVSFTQNIDDAGAATAIGQLAALPTAPQVVVMIALEQDAIKLVDAWDNGGAPVIPGMQFFMTDGARSSGFLTGAPASVHGMCGTAPTFPFNGLAYTTLKDAYEAVNDDVIEDQVFAPNVWDGFFLIAAAAGQQAVDYPGEPLGGAHLRDALTPVSRDGQIFKAADWRDLIISIRDGHDVDYDGAAGPNDFDEHGQAVGPYEVWCIAPDGSTFDQVVYLDARQVQALTM